MQNIFTGKSTENRPRSTKQQTRAVGTTACNMQQATAYYMLHSLHMLLLYAISICKIWNTESTKALSEAQYSPAAHTTTKPNKQDKSFRLNIVQSGFNWKNKKVLQVYYGNRRKECCSQSNHAGA